LTATACAALAFVTVGAGAVGAKLYGGVQLWLSGNKAAVVVHSFSMIDSPSAAEVRAVTANATFPAIYPVGLPAGTHLIRISFTPADRPNAIFVEYRNPRARFNAGFALFDSTAINAGEVSMPVADARHRFGEVYQWRTGSETVVIPKDALSASYAGSIEAAMNASSTAESLSANTAILWSIRRLGGSFDLADVAERLAPATRGVLVDRGNLRLVPGLARAGKPLLGSRVLSLTNIPEANGGPDYAHATYTSTKDIAVPSDGVRAIASVMRAAGESGRRSDCCEILYTPPSEGAYAIWTIPMSGKPVRRYVVSARSFTVEP
jgi:hypothetical protein